MSQVNVETFNRATRRAWAFLMRTVNAIRLLARDERIPKPLRWVAGIGLLPIPGPVDEFVLILIAPIFLAFYRKPMREAWGRSPRPNDALEAAGLRD